MDELTNVPLSDDELDALLGHLNHIVVRDGTPGVGYGTTPAREQQIRRDLIRAVHELAHRRNHPM